MEGDLTWGGEHTIQYTDDVLYNCIPGSYVILLTNVIPINSIANKCQCNKTRAMKSCRLKIKRQNYIYLQKT